MSNKGTAEEKRVIKQSKSVTSQSCPGKKKKPTNKRPEGRPTKYSEEMDTLICDLLVQGYSLRKICAIENMPSIVSVMAWLQKYPEFLKHYECARELQAEKYAEEIVDIADDGINDYGFKEGDDQSGESAFPVFIKENVLRSKLRVDARKWVAANLLPKKYGEKKQVDMNMGGSITVNLIDYATLLK
jgi:hypothetical protein